MDLNLASVKHPLIIKAIAITVKLKADNFLESSKSIFSSSTCHWIWHWFLYSYFFSRKFCVLLVKEVCLELVSAIFEIFRIVTKYVPWTSIIITLNHWRQMWNQKPRKKQYTNFTKIVSKFKKKILSRFLFTKSFRK